MQIAVRELARVTDGLKRLLHLFAPVCVGTGAEICCCFYPFVLSLSVLLLNLLHVMLVSPKPLTITECTSQGEEDTERQGASSYLNKCCAYRIPVIHSRLSVMLFTFFPSSIPPD